MSIETYGKRYDRQFKRRSPEYRGYTTSIQDGYLLRTEPPEGGGTAYGCEASFSSAGKPRFFYSGCGTWSVSRNEYIDGSLYTDNYGNCLKGSLLTGFTFSNEQVVTASLLAMTGRWYPRLNGLWTHDMDNNIVALYDSPYADRLDPIYSLSVRYTFEHHFKKCSAGGYAEAVNILNKKQVIDRETDRIGYLDHRMLGIIPNVALMLKF